MLWRQTLIQLRVYVSPFRHLGGAGEIKGEIISPFRRRNQLVSPRTLNIAVTIGARSNWYDRTALVVRPSSFLLHGLFNGKTQPFLSSLHRSWLSFAIVSWRLCASLLRCLAGIARPYHKACCTVAFFVYCPRCRLLCCYIP